MRFFVIESFGTIRRIVPQPAGQAKRAHKKIALFHIVEQKKEGAGGAAGAAQVHADAILRWPGGYVQRRIASKNLEKIKKICHKHMAYLHISNRWSHASAKLRFRTSHLRASLQISPSEGCVSVDRSSETALLGTTPWPRTKSSANDFALWPIWTFYPACCASPDVSHPVLAR